MLLFIALRRLAIIILPMEETELRIQMCRIAARLWERNLVGAAEGNLSARLGEGRFLCTPTGLSKGHLDPADLVVIDRDGRSQGRGSPSSEIKLHLGIYRARADCMAVIHAHPPTATAFTVTCAGTGCAASRCAPASVVTTITGTSGELRPR